MTAHCSLFEQKVLPSDAFAIGPSFVRGLLGLFFSNYHASLECSGHFESRSPIYQSSPGHCVFMRAKGFLGA